MASATPSCCARACRPRSAKTCCKSADYEIYVRDRSPQVRFTGRNYVLPRVGQEGIPVVSVNTTKVAVDVIRVGDRNLSADGPLRGFPRRSSAAIAHGSIVDENGVKMWIGHARRDATELNRDVITAFPVLEAVGKLEPGVYVMMARPANGRSRTRSPTSDDGYSKRRRRNGSSSPTSASPRSRARTACMCSCARSRAPSLSTASRSASSPATTRCSPHARPTRNGHVALRSRPCARQGRPRARRRSSRRKGERLRLSRSRRRRLRSHRPRREGPRRAARALDAFLYPERGVYRSGETVSLSALLRDARGAAVAGLPLTLVVKRPDGVEYRRVSVEDQGLGGRALLASACSRARRTARGACRPIADPKGPAVGEATSSSRITCPSGSTSTLTPQRCHARAGRGAARSTADALPLRRARRRISKSAARSSCRRRKR